MIKLSLTQQKDFGMTNITCIASLWCSLKTTFQLPERSEENLESGLTRQYWYLVMADLTEMSGEDLLLTIQHQQNCDLEHLRENCPIYQLWR